ncbi:MAG TPA: SRPBCC family protein [Gaiellales bacterium]|nr:SRPBCC family protein [Gaiellales bacterium]
MSVVIEQRASVGAAAKDVFAFLHDPDRRQQWDAMTDLARLEDATEPAVGVRVHLRGRRTAPSWVGEYAELAPPQRSVLRLVEGVGMPFSAFSQTIEVAPVKGGSTITLRLEYQARGLASLLEPVVLRPRLTKAVRRSLAGISSHFV